MPTFKPHEYQREAFNFLMNRIFIEGNLGGGLFLDPGLGKTSVTCWLIQALRSIGFVDSTLIIAPLRAVDNVWPDEIEKWGFNLTYRKVTGTPGQRIKALRQSADVYLINPENVAWLQKQTHLPFDFLVVDESTKFKSWMAKRTRALKRMLSMFAARVILTGTPSPNSMADLFAQMYLVDDGESLGRTLTVFRNRTCNRGGYEGREWLFRPECQSLVEQLIAPAVIRMDAADHLDLPEKVDHVIWVSLDRAEKRQYKSLERELAIALGEDKTLTASNSGAKYTMCRSFANGGVYEILERDEKDRPTKRKTHHVHDKKLEALVDLVEELQGKPVLVAYQFKHDLERIRKAYPKAPVINGDTKPADDTETLRRWNRREIPILLVQPQAMSHAVNAQDGGNDIVWFGLSDQLEIELQFNARLHRQGVKGQVRIHRILTRGTVDEAILDRIRQKDTRQTALLNSLKRYLRGKDSAR